MSKRFYALRIAIYCACIGLASHATPVISNVPSQFDFARIEPMSNPTRAMEIANNGDTPLAIHRVRACCGAKAEISATNIAPGAAVTLTVSLGKIARPGPFRKKVTLYTSDPSAPVVELPIVGEVIEAKVEAREDEAVVYDVSTAREECHIVSKMIGYRFGLLDAVARPGSFRPCVQILTSQA